MVSLDESLIILSSISLICFFLYVRVHPGRAEWYLKYVSFFLFVGPIGMGIITHQLPDFNQPWIALVVWTLLNMQDVLFAGLETREMAPALCTNEFVFAIIIASTRHLLISLSLFSTGTPRDNLWSAYLLVDLFVSLLALFVGGTFAMDTWNIYHRMAVYTMASFWMISIFMTPQNREVVCLWSCVTGLLGVGNYMLAHNPPQTLKTI